jgi:hypothetical protein
MYDHGWYNTFVPRATIQPCVESASFKRRETTTVSLHVHPWVCLLIVLQGTLTADTAAPESLSNGASDSITQKGPPATTLTRRAKSYSDFYDAARAYLEKEQKQERKQRNVLYKRQGSLRTESEFAAWYSGVKSQLEDASQEEYQ